MKIFLQTFGCTYNQADSQIMTALLEKASHIMVDNIEESDLIIINSCYVKKPTEQKLINLIRSIVEDYPDKNLLIGGCMVDIDPDRLDKLSKEASWIGPHQITSAPMVVNNIENGEIIRLTGFSKIEKAGLPKKRDNPLIHIIQICEGCTGICSYCCTRFARGKLQSYPIENLKSEATAAIEEGVIEIQLTAQDTAAYGADDGSKLSDLINEISSIKGKFKIRIGMMHPQNLLRDLNSIIESFQNEKVYKFLHLPIQSGNDTVLNDMNREYNSSDLIKIVKMFKKKVPDISIATDVIVGYPTENMDAFNDTLEMVRNIRPDFLHISKYHHRPGTLSSDLDEIGHDEMKKRSKMLNKLKNDIATQKNQGLIGTYQNVVITSKGSKGGYIGRTNSYKTVIIQEASLGEFFDVKITGAKSTYLEGTK